MGNEYYVYVLFSKFTKKFYVGMTDNIENRLLYHRRGNNKAPNTSVNIGVSIENFKYVYFKITYDKEKLTGIIGINDFRPYTCKIEDTITTVLENYLKNTESFNIITSYMDDYTEGHRYKSITKAEKERVNNYVNTEKNNHKMVFGGNQPKKLVKYLHDESSASSVEGESNIEFFTSLIDKVTILINERINNIPKNVWDITKVEISKVQEKKYIEIKEKTVL